MAEKPHMTAASSSHSALTAIESVDLPDGFMVSSEDPQSSHFDKIVGILEDIVVGEEFQGLQNYYLSKYWASFGHTGETDLGNNTYQHFQIFKDYSQEMSTFLELRLKTIVPSFNIEEFIKHELGPRIESAKAAEDATEEKSNFIDSEICDMLFTLVDFIKFKELLVDYGKMMEGKTPNLSVGQTSLISDMPEED